MKSAPATARVGTTTGLQPLGSGPVQAAGTASPARVPDAMPFADLVEVA